MKASLAAVGVLVACASLSGCQNSSTESASQRAPAHLNAAYFIAGQRVRLVDGVSDSAAAPGSAARVVTRYFGNDINTDLDGDGRADTVFLLTQQTGGSGTFFYVVAALDRPEGLVGSQGLLIGDRIAPQSTTVDPHNRIVVNYADRATGESFADPPTVGRSLFLHFDAATLQFGEVVQ
jgi:hypothetical protein